MRVSREGASTSRMTLGASDTPNCRHRVDAAVWTTVDRRGYCRE